MLEVFDPANQFRFVRKVQLLKNAEKEVFMKDGNSRDFLNRDTTRWFTNGK